MRKTFLLYSILMLLATSGIAFGAKLPAQTLNLPDTGAVADDDEKPDVTARVARISFIRGDVKIKRVDNDVWETAVLNLPLIEGDEIATGNGARLELQLNNYVHVRLDGEAYLKFAVMKDEGVAVSLSQGTMNVRVTDLDRAGGYFEIDAPRTTIAVEKSGSYRVDAGRVGEKELHLSVTNGGAARIYSENAGFTLKSGRGARVFIDGANAGEWETAEAAKFGDDFDTWAAERDSQIAKSLAAAYYDKYYDQDIYGADDLNGYGEWVYTSTYGYVWRPYSTSLAGYSNWSPYRYGHWRWLGPYGWTWVNDEPWGWATYHHGRWVWDRGHWVWCPYGYYRPKRSWWFPAIVSITIINNNFCWYPLGYHHPWHNYNGNGHNGNGWGGGHNGGSDPNRKPPYNGGRKPPIRPGLGGGKEPTDVTGEIPPDGVVTASKDDFGSIRRGPRLTPKDLAAEAIKSGTAEVSLPDPRQVMGRKENGIVASRPADQPVAISVKTGAAVRRDDRPLDDELRTKRIFGERKPVTRNDDVNVGGETPRGGRVTGAVDRPPRVENGGGDAKPAERVERKPRDTVPDRIVVESPRPAERETKPREQPRYEPPVRSEPKQERPSRVDPPARQPRSDPPARPPQNDTPKAPPKQESRPAEKPSVVDRKGEAKDGK